MGWCVIRTEDWRKSSYSSDSDCLEIARRLPAFVAVRDSKYAHGPMLVFDQAEWERFTRRIKSGEF
jgi:hypothetical protein